MLHILHGRICVMFQEISVVGEADLLAATISRKRKFTFLHGRILPTHDKFGQKQGMSAFECNVRILSVGIYMLLMKMRTSKHVTLK